MRQSAQLALFTTLLISLTSAWAIPKGVYGQDDRIEASLHPNEIIRKQSLSVAAMIFKAHIKEIPGQLHELIRGSYGEFDNFCKEVPFQGQAAASNCTAFLISPTRVMTAGHCIKSTYQCNDTLFVFNYNQENITGPFPPYDRHHIKDADIYRCKNIDITVHSKKTMEDYAIVELDRPVLGREPLKLRSQGKISNGTGVYMIGTPGGLPLKVADNAYVYDSAHPIYFRTNLDAFNRNSGSPVFNEQTGEIEGILVRGRPDYERKFSCDAIKICDEKNCPEGEEVTKVSSTKFKDYLK